MGWIEKLIGEFAVQTAVYWGNPQSDGYGGYTFDSPVEIECRWDGKTEVITNDNGEEIISKAEVLVTQDLDEGGYLYLGALSDLSSNPDDPMEVDGAYKIQRFIKTPGVKSTTDFLRIAYL